MEYKPVVFLNPDTVFSAAVQFATGSTFADRMGLNSNTRTVQPDAKGPVQKEALRAWRDEWTVSEKLLVLPWTPSVASPLDRASSSGGWAPCWAAAEGCDLMGKLTYDEPCQKWPLRHQLPLRSYFKDWFRATGGGARL